MDMTVVDLGRPSPVDAGTTGHRLRPRRRRRADRGASGPTGPKPSSTRSSPASAPGAARAGHPARPRTSGASDDPRPPIRVAVIGGGRDCEHDVSLASAAGGGRRAGPGGATTSSASPSTRRRWRDGEDRPIGLAGAVERPALLRGRRPRAARSARRGRHARGAVRPGRRAVRRIRRRRGRAGDGQVGHQARRRGARHRHGARRGCSRAATAVATRLHPPGRGQAGRAPARATGSRLVATAAELGPALDAAFAVDDRVLVEDLVTGREIDVAVLGRPDGSRVVAPALEIVTERDLRPGAQVRRHRRLPGPGRCSTTSSARTSRRRRCACTTRSAAAGVARVDFFLTARRAGAQRGEHDARLHRAVAGAADVRRRRHVVRRPARPAGARRARRHRAAW